MAYRNPERETLFKTKTRFHNDRVFTVSYGLARWVNINQPPYFSITYSSADSCGANPDLIAKIFPKLADLVKWHCCDHNGIPMHYIQNASFFQDVYNGYEEYYTRRPIFDVIKGHICYGVCEDDGGDEDLHYILKSYDHNELTEWLDSRREDLGKAFREACEKHGLKRFE